MRSPSRHRWMFHLLYRFMSRLSDVPAQLACRERITAAVIAELSTVPGGIDLWFIYGGHFYSAPLSDCQRYSPPLARHAIMAMHDIGWAEGVQGMLDEDISPRIRREWCLSNLWWGQLAT